MDRFNQIVSFYEQRGYPHTHAVAIAKQVIAYEQYSGENISTVRLVRV